jgi:hypothetical protein
VEVGLVGVAGLEIAHSGYAITGLQPKLASDTITHEATLHRTDGQTIISFMMEFFEKVNKDSGVPRPKCPSGNILNPLNRFDSKEVT